MTDRQETRTLDFVDLSQPENVLNVSEVQHPQVDTGSQAVSPNDALLLEQTFEVITKEVMGDEAKADSRDPPRPRLGTTTSLTDIESRGQQSSNKEKRDVDRVRKSGSFLARLQSSFPTTSEEEGSPNIPSSIVNAFTSLTSSFNIGTSTSTNGNNSSNSNSSNVNSSASSLKIETSSAYTRSSQANETKEDISDRKAILERKNLISLTKLIVKDLISSSIEASRIISDDCQNTVHLNNYFTLIDRVLKHGLKQNLLSHRSMNLWNALDSLPKYLKESTMMSESVRSLASTKTPDGKIKAWMRLAMMQKKLPEYFNELLANKNVLLKDIYHDYAFMMNDEAQVFAGLIIGVNVIDCNFFAKDANFDLMDDIIDLGPYLRLANSCDVDDDQISKFSDSTEIMGEDKLTAILDQKNYLEEWNKRLATTISNLQAKIKSLEEQNSKLEMEIKVSEARILKLTSKTSEHHQEKHKSIAGAIKSLIGTTGDNEPDKLDAAKDKFRSVETKEIDAPKLNEAVESASEQKEVPASQPEVVEVTVTKPVREDSKSTENGDRVSELEMLVKAQEKELLALRERTSILETSYRSSLEKIKVLERDLELQTSMNADKETTIMIYEKDIRDKQTQVENLRASLADSKKLNSDLSERLNDTTVKLKERIKAITNLQVSVDKWKLENKTLGSRLQDKLSILKSMSGELEKAKSTIEDLKSYNEKINEELKKERESGRSSSVTLESQNFTIKELSNKLSKLEDELANVNPYKDRATELEKRCKEYEQSLEEIGEQLRESRLEVENLRENSAVFLDSQWIDSKQIKACCLCHQTFSVIWRKHHCRLCGNVFCQTCSDNKMELASSAKPARVCDTCHAFLLAKFVKSSS